MSDNRKILVPKRKQARNNNNSAVVNNILTNNRQDSNIAKRGIKRSGNISPAKNIANERLKKLRTSLNEQVQQKTFKQSTRTVRNFVNQNLINTSPLGSNRKPPSVRTDGIFVTKMPTNNLFDSQINNSPLLKSSGNYTAFKAGISQKSIFTTQSTTTSVFDGSSTSNVNSSTVEKMEWDPTDEEQLLTVPSSTSLPNKTLIHPENFYIVVDTNIFLSHMALIKNILEMDVTGIKKPVIFIPWIVIEELDFIKDDRTKSNVKRKAQEAIKYIEKTLSNKHERMMGQTLEQANEQKDVGEGQDNKIISCCIQVMTKYQHMILLTEDINLKNKAHISYIPVCSHQEIMNKIILGLRNQSKSQIILEKMRFLCNTVIKNCAQKAYGVACNQMEICRAIPQTVPDCVKVFNKYWFPVFQENLLKQSKKTINDLSSFIIKNKVITDGSQELHELVRLCIRVCIFLKDIDSCKDLVENTIREMNNIKDS